MTYQSSGVGNEILLLDQLGKGLARRFVVERRAKRREGRVGLQRIERGRLGRDLCLELGSLGGIVLGVLCEQRGVVGDDVGLLDGVHLVAVVLHVLDGKDLVAGRHEGRVAGERRQGGGAGRSLGLELGGLGGIALGVFVELGRVGDEIVELRQLGDFLALRLGGCAVSLGEGGTSHGKDERGVELHFYWDEKRN